MRKSMRDFYDVIFNKVKLFILWWTRIFFAPQHFKTPFLKKFITTLMVDLWLIKLLYTI